jgi:hypothetical protein
MRYIFALTLAAAATLAAADLPYAGKWKMNPAKSAFGEMTVTFTDLGSGEMQFLGDGQSYKFKVDGKDCPSFFGQTAAWKQLDANTWQIVEKLNGKVLTTDTDTLSADGKILTYNAKGAKENGGAMDETIVFNRVSGGPGLAGKWKAKNFKSSSPETMELAASGDDGLKLTVLDFNLTCDAKFDGKDYPCTGPTIAQGWTLAVKKSGAQVIDTVYKMNGKPLYQMTLTVSADGKTLTETGSAVGVSEKFKAVYDRQ